jgi:tetratricopeptide (TPR) repeat protein
LHNTGVTAAKEGRLPEAERFFDAAIQRDPEAAVSWVARGIVRGEQAKTEQAAADFTHAAQLYATRGDQSTAEQLLQASAKLQKEAKPDKESGNGMGSQMVSGAMGVIQFLLPLAAKAFIPLAF